MVRLPALVFALVLGAGALAELEAQRVPVSTLPRVGTRVRVWAAGMRPDAYVGQIVGFPADSVTIDTTGVRRRLGFETGPVLVEEYREVSIPLVLVDRVETSGGKTYRRSMIKGSIIGAVVGALLWGASALPEVNPGFGDFVSGMPVGALVGGAIGAGAGYLFAGERWEAYPPPESGSR
jgi:hypothetical protein